MIFYKVRRKADGLFARNGVSCIYGAHGKKGKTGLPSGWGVGQVYSEKAFLSIRRLYNQLGGPASNWNNTTREYEPITPTRPGSSGLLYKDIELVKYGPGGEIVVWTDTRCRLTPEEAKKFIPTGSAPLTGNERRAGLSDEMGVILGEIEAAEKDLTAGKAFDIEGLSAKIEIKRMRLASAIEELDSCQSNLQATLLKKMGL